MKCEHFEGLEPATPRARVCEECVKLGWQWLHLRVCLTCGHVGCCDSSRGRHATQHFQTTAHPLIGPVEPGERWAWCYIDRAMQSWD